MIIDREDAIHKAYTYFDTYYQDASERYIDIELLLMDIYRSVGRCIKCEYRDTKDCPLLDAISEVDLNTYYCASFDRKEL